MSKKTIFSAILIVIMMFSACSRQKNNSKEDFDVEIYPTSKEDFDVEINLSSEGSERIFITGYTGESKKVKIPQYIQNLPVVVIENRAFYDKELASVTIPESIISIGWHAFAKNRLTNIIIPGNIRGISKYAFADNQLTSVIIPDSIRRIGEGAFARNNLKSITIPDSVLDIAEFAFSSNQLTNIVISEKIRIDASAFDNEFAGFYLENGSKAGNYTYDNGNWKVIFIEKPKIDFMIDGVYEITAAYSHLYNDFSLEKIKTEKLGLSVTINNNKAIFENIEYQIYEGNGYSSYTKDNLLEYEDFLYMFVGMNYGGFNENIIGKEYTGKVKAMTMKNNENDYYIFFADNKLIIMISAWEKGEDTETEFNHLIISRHDSFFYIAERIIE